MMWTNYKSLSIGQFNLKSLKTQNGITLFEPNPAPVYNPRVEIDISASVDQDIWFYCSPVAGGQGLVDWGDGSTTDIVDYYTRARHTYASSRPLKIKFYGCSDVGMMQPASNYSGITKIWYYDDWFKTNYGGAGFYMSEYTYVSDLQDIYFANSTQVVPYIETFNPDFIPTRLPDFNKIFVPSGLYAEWMAQTTPKPWAPLSGYVEGV